MKGSGEEDSRKRGRVEVGESETGRGGMRWKQGRRREKREDEMGVREEGGEEGK